MKKQNVRKVLLLCLAALGATVAAVAVIIWINGSSHALPEEVTPIHFDVTGWEEIGPDHVLTGDVTALARSVSVTESPLWYGGEQSVPEEVSARFSTPDCQLKKDKDGTFSLTFLQVSESVAPTQLSDARFISIATDFLSENGLLCDDLVVSKVAHDRLVGENDEIVVGASVGFFSDRGGGNTIGNARVTVHMNADGEIIEVIYNHVHDMTCITAALIPVKEAFDTAARAVKGDDVNARIELTGNPDPELAVREVQLNYYDTVTGSASSRQPVYTFIGATDDGGTFAVSVPAVKYK